MAQVSFVDWASEDVLFSIETDVVPQVGHLIEFEFRENPSAPVLFESDRRASVNAVGDYKVIGVKHLMSEIEGVIGLGHWVYVTVERLAA